MYSAIVKRLAARNFDLVTAKRYDELLASCAPDVTHRFGGSHALGGRRQGREALGRWLRRLGRLVPDLRLRVADIWVSGPPWRMTVIIRWTGAATMPDGAPYHQHGVHVVALRWGRVTSIDANEDSQAVAELMAALAAHGVDEAAAAPLLD